MNPLNALPDSHRRVAGNLSVPRTLTNLLLFVSRHDAENLRLGDIERSPVEHLEVILRELEQEGLVKNIGNHNSPESVLEYIEADGDLIDIPAEKAENYVAIVGNPRKATLSVDGELWVLTQAGLAALKEGDE